MSCIEEPTCVPWRSSIHAHSHRSICFIGVGSKDLALLEALNKLTLSMCSLSVPEACCTPMFYYLTCTHMAQWQHGKNERTNGAYLCLRGTCKDNGTKEWGLKFNQARLMLFLRLAIQGWLSRIWSCKWPCYHLALPKRKLLVHQWLHLIRYSHCLGIHKLKVHWLPDFAIAGRVDSFMHAVKCGWITYVLFIPLSKQEKSMFLWLAFSFSGVHSSRVDLEAAYWKF